MKIQLTFNVSWIKVQESSSPLVLELVAPPPSRRVGGGNRLEFALAVGAEGSSTWWPGRGTAAKRGRGSVPAKFWTLVSSGNFTLLTQTSPGQQSGLHRAEGEGLGPLCELLPPPPDAFL